MFTNEYLQNYLSEDSRIVREFECSHGRADIVRFNLRKNWDEHLSLGEIKPQWSYALKAIPYRKTFTTIEFSSIAGVSESYALRALNCYTRAGYCMKGAKKGLWIKVKQPRLIANRIISYEAKIRNWSRALDQAYRYKEYSDESWVILDQYYVASALANIEKFKKYNIGLSALDTFGNLQIYFKARQEPPRSELNSWTANSMLAQSLIAQNRPNR